MPLPEVYPQPPDDTVLSVITVEPRVAPGVNMGSSENGDSLGASSVPGAALDAPSHAAESGKDVSHKSGATFGAAVPAAASEAEAGHPQVVLEDSGEKPGKRTLWERLQSVSRGTWVRTFALAVFLILVIVLAGVLMIHKEFADLLDYLRDSDNLGASACIFISVYVAATLLLVPGSVLVIGAGYVYGLGIGIGFVLIASAIAEVLAFLLGRYMFRDFVARKAHENHKFMEIERAIQVEGKKLIVLIRLAPFLPYSLLNYLLAASSIDFKDYAIFSVIGTIPGIVLYVWIGSLAEDLSSGDMKGQSDVRLAVLIVGVLVCVALVAYVTVLARRALKRAALRAQEMEEQPIPQDA